MNEPDALDVACPECGARPHYACLSRLGRPRRYHPHRLRAAEDAQRRDAWAQQSLLEPESHGARRTGGATC